MSIWYKLAAQLAIVGVLVGWHLIEKKHAVDKALEKQRVVFQMEIDKEIARAKETTASLLSSTLTELQEKENEIKKLNTRLSSLTDSLQQRPSRTDNTSTSGNSKACTGAELPREDGTFLAREAARADRILKERDFYYEQYNRAREALNSHQRGDG